MAGPGMRYHQIAQRLSVNHKVTLATFNPEHSQPVKGATYHLTSIKSYDFRDDFDRYDVIIAMALNHEMINYAKQKKIGLIFDLYAPVPVEDLIAKVFGEKTGPDEAYNYSSLIAQYQSLLQSGDYFLCSNEIQKDMWLGFALSGGATSPVTYSSFPLYERIGLLPMGINLDELKQPYDISTLQKRVPSIKKSDFVILWTGGIWDWFDALTPIEAVRKLVEDGYDDIKLVFLGTKHPNENVPEMKETVAAYKIARDTGLYDKNVFFLEGWVDYDARLSYLLRADIALYAHKPSMEARYSHRTRVLDHFLACVPTVATRDDYLADVVAEKQLGVVVEALNVDDMADAIRNLHDNKKLRQRLQNNIRSVQEEFTWQKAMSPLESYLERPLTSRPVTKLPSSRISKTENPIVKAVKRTTPKWIKKRVKSSLHRYKH